MALPGVCAPLGAHLLDDLKRDLIRLIWVEATLRFAQFTKHLPELIAGLIDLPVTCHGDDHGDWLSGLFNDDFVTLFGNA